MAYYRTRSRYWRDRLHDDYYDDWNYNSGTG